MGAGGTSWPGKRTLLKITPSPSWHPCAAISCAIVRKHRQVPTFFRPGGIVLLTPLPPGGILLAADGTGLTGLWFEGQECFGRGLDGGMDGTSPVLETAVRWLGVYFPGKGPPFPVPLHLCGTASQLAVWDRLRAIPYGQTATDGQAPRSWRRREAGSASLRRP